MQSPLTFILAFVVVLALIGAVAWGVRRFAGNRLGTNTQRGRMPRLAVIDAAAVDGRRRLVLVRRDNVEHLLMIGGPTDIVVDADGVRYVSELSSRVTILDEDDHAITRIGGQELREPGQFVAPHSLWLDSEGSLYVTEVLEGQRVQKFKRV